MRLDCQEIGLNGLPRRIGLLEFEPLAFFGKRRQRFADGGAKLRMRKEAVRQAKG